ncbi:MAG TPA: hypothetical protein VHN99_03695, partial [Deinococcales bacterium]|nr:hypothetical protein [Deinococcales bacterium]
TWQAVAIGSAPRVAALENAGQATTRAIIGQGLTPAPLPFERLQGGLPNEALLVQVLHPLTGLDLLGLTPSPEATTIPGPAFPRPSQPSSPPIVPVSTTPPAPMPQPTAAAPAVDDRPNSLLDELDEVFA